MTCTFPLESDQDVLLCVILQPLGDQDSLVVLALRILQPQDPHRSVVRHHRRPLCSSPAKAKCWQSKNIVAMITFCSLWSRLILDPKRTTSELIWRVWTAARPPDHDDYDHDKYYGRLLDHLIRMIMIMISCSTTLPSLSLLAAVIFSSTVMLCRGLSPMKMGRSSGTPELRRRTPPTWPSVLSVLIELRLELGRLLLSSFWSWGRNRDPPPERGSPPDLSSFAFFFRTFFFTRFFFPPTSTASSSILVWKLRSVWSGQEMQEQPIKTTEALSFLFRFDNLSFH